MDSLFCYLPALNGNPFISVIFFSDFYNFTANSTEGRILFTAGFSIGSSAFFLQYAKNDFIVCIRSTYQWHPKYRRMLNRVPKFEIVSNYTWPQHRHVRTCTLARENITGQQCVDTACFQPAGRQCPASGNEAMK